MVHVAQCSCLTENEDQWLDEWNWDIYIITILLLRPIASDRKTSYN